MTKRLTLIEIQERSNIAHNNKFIIHNKKIVTSPKGNKITYIELECRICNYRNYAAMSNHVSKKKPIGCRNCSGQTGWTKEKVQNRSNEIHKNKFIIHKIWKKEYGNYNKKTMYGDIECKDCSYRFEASMSNHIHQGNGCKKCEGLIPMTIEEVIEKSNSLIFHNFIKHSINIELNNSGFKKSRITAECGICGYITKQQPSVFLLMVVEANVNHILIEKY